MIDLTNDTALNSAMERICSKIGDMGLKYYIETYGCQMNEHDSEKIAGMLVKCGYTKAD